MEKGPKKVDGITKLIIMFVLILFTSTISNSAWAGFKFQLSEEAKGEIGLWTQVWYQFVEDAKDSDADGVGDRNLNDFMVRRTYFYIKGQVTPKLSLFTHIAADRVGQEGLDNPSVGLGSGAAFRDLWITVNLDEAFKIQAGRMYIPLTRNYGTTSTKAMLTTELAFLQGGVRGNIFYASKVGRDDGVVIWGNPSDGTVQYRLMVSEGVEGAGNPDDHLRFVGRMAINLRDAETGWFNKGTYLGKKEILSLGVGGDSQRGLSLGNRTDQGNQVWTVDLFLDQPAGDGAFTVEAALINIQNTTQTSSYTNLAAGMDALNWYAQAGFLLPDEIGSGKLQPYVRYEGVEVDGAKDTNFWGGGLNYYIRGHNAKLSVDVTHVNQDKRSRTVDHATIVTGQIALGF